MGVAIRKRKGMRWGCRRLLVCLAAARAAAGCGQRVCVPRHALLSQFLPLTQSASQPINVHLIDAQLTQQPLPLYLNPYAIVFTTLWLLFNMHLLEIY